MRLRYDGRLNRADWYAFLAKFEKLARQLNIPEKKKTQHFSQIVPAGLQFMSSKGKVKFHRLNISGFSRSVTHNVVERFLEQNVACR